MEMNTQSLINACRGAYEWPDADRSYSPLFSSIGVAARAGEPGFGQLYFHYNRATRPVFERTVAAAPVFSPERSDLARLVCGDAALSLSFFGTNAFTVFARGEKEIEVFAHPSPRTELFWYEGEENGTHFFFGFSKNADARDPDERVPFSIALRVLKGRATITEDRRLISAEDGEIYLAAVLRLLTPDRQEMSAVLESAPGEPEKADIPCREWLAETTRDLSVGIADAREEKMLRDSVTGLLMNLTRAEGALAKHISAFPSRGEYPTHFLWDTCFQNLLYERMSEDLAKDLLMQNIRNIREDGKFPQFLCSTWARPLDTQPALIGWAGLRLLRRRFDKPFARFLLDAIERNNRWWLTQRITRIGLIYARDGLETGQDNSPRLDGGRRRYERVSAQPDARGRCDIGTAGAPEPGGVLERKGGSLRRADRQIPLRRGGRFVLRSAAFGSLRRSGQIPFRAAAGMGRRIQRRR